MTTMMVTTFQTGTRDDWLAVVSAGELNIFFHRIYLLTISD